MCLHGIRDIGGKTKQIYEILKNNMLKIGWPQNSGLKILLLLLKMMEKRIIFLRLLLMLLF